MLRRPPRSTRTDTPFPYTTLFRSLWSFRKMREFHGGGSTSRSNRAQGGYISKHFGQRHLGLDHLRATAGVHAFQLAAALVEITHDRSEERRVGKECVSTCRSRWSPYP